MPKPTIYFPDLIPELKLFDDENMLEIWEEEVKSILSNDEIKKEPHLYPVKILYDGTTSVDSKYYPELYKILNVIPNIERVFVVELPIKSEQPQRKGCSSFANNTLRCIVPVKISGKRRSGMWVDGQPKLFDEGTAIIYDHSRINYVYNKHKRSSTYLVIFDVKRPHSIPFGISDENHNIMF